MKKQHAHFIADSTGLYPHDTSILPVERAEKADNISSRKFGRAGRINRAVKFFHFFNFQIVQQDCNTIDKLPIDKC